MLWINWGGIGKDYSGSLRIVLFEGLVTEALGLSLGGSILKDLKERFKKVGERSESWRWFGIRNLL
jgi:hypothetical protein